MALVLNKKLLIGFMFSLLSITMYSQTEEITPVYNDYKDHDQFYKFHKRSKVIGAWQINKLKEGALIIRLRTNKTAIDALLAQGNTTLAKEKEAETYIINKNIVQAYTNNFTFCKLYFMLSSSSDSLLKGMRSGIFLDTNLLVNPSIELKESYYLIGERDYAYNSSIGFVKEDSAKLVREGGNPVREMGVVIKNCYGHQLKNPFPYYIKDKTFVDYGLPFYVLPQANGLSFVWVMSEDLNARKTLKASYPERKEELIVKVRKQFTYKNVSLIVQQLDRNLSSYYNSTSKPEAYKLGPDIKPYLY
jgi:hypothetical protein